MCRSRWKPVWWMLKVIQHPVAPEKPWGQERKRGDSAIQVSVWAKRFSVSTQLALSTETSESDCMFFLDGVFSNGSSQFSLHPWWKFGRAGFFFTAGFWGSPLGEYGMGMRNPHGETIFLGCLWTIEFCISRDFLSQVHHNFQWQNVKMFFWFLGVLLIGTKEIAIRTSCEF